MNDRSNAICGSSQRSDGVLEGEPNLQNLAIVLLDLSAELFQLLLLALPSLRVVGGAAVVGELEDLELVVLVTGDVAFLLQALNLASSDLQAVSGDAGSLLLQEPGLGLLEIYFGFHHNALLG